MLTQFYVLIKSQSGFFSLSCILIHCKKLSFKLSKILHKKLKMQTLSSPSFLILVSLSSKPPLKISSFSLLTVSTPSRPRNQKNNSIILSWCKKLGLTFIKLSNCRSLTDFKKLLMEDLNCYKNNFNYEEVKSMSKTIFTDYDKDRDNIMSHYEIANLIKELICFF